jgi:hypothetical protein
MKTTVEITYGKNWLIITAVGYALKTTKTNVDEIKRLQAKAGHNLLGVN